MIIVLFVLIIMLITVSVIEFIDIDIENEADLIAVLKKISPFFKWENIGRILEQGEQR